MKKVVLFIVALMAVLTINAGTKKSVKLSFDKQQFSFVKNSVGAVKIVISSTIGNRQRTYSLSKDNPTITADVSTFSSGVLTVSLFANGQLVDSRNITK